MARVSADKILNLARQQIGVQATNYKKCKYNTAFYGYVVSASWADWCAAFIWWLFHECGADSMLYVKTAGCGVLGNAFYTRGRFKTSGYKAGDIVFFHWSNDRSESVPITYTLDHVGIIEKVNADGSYTTIEGNTGGGNGEVMRRTRYAKDISGVGRPDYTSGATTTDSSTNAVKDVQKWLNSSYSAKLTVDGIYGGKTELALVKALQTDLNKSYSAKLTVDGIFGTKTYNAIRNLKSGAKGNYVKTLQALLICHGYDTGGLDGIFGTKTTAAVKTYQSQHGLYSDGIAGKATFDELCG
ncbi:MAG: peptidoglycan-binding protein [Ruminococcus sp.]|nr:peptidoglycan-binding protein [Ruminococcus sp.]